jgi:6-phosphofructokinase 1
MKRIGILTAGGDTPALNATLHGAVTRANERRVDVIGFIKGFNSLLNPRVPHVRLNPLYQTIPELDSTYGGTIIGASRDYVDDQDSATVQAILERLEKLRIDGLICVGGDGTLNALQAVSEHFPTVLAPKTIDNDLGLNYISEPTEWELDPADPTAPPALRRRHRDMRLEDMVNYVTPGFATSVFVSVQGIVRIRTTAESHRRIGIIELMGRQSGFLALGSAYGQPDIILVPEQPINPDHLVERVLQLYEVQKHAVIVVAEGVVDKSGRMLGEAENRDPAGNMLYDGAADAVRSMLLERLDDRYFASRRRNVSARAAIFTRKVGHTQRGGRPILFDRFYAAQLGGKAVDMLLEGHRNSVAILQWDRERGYSLDAIEANRLRDKWGEIHPRLMHPSFYDPERLQPSPKGADYLAPIFTNAVGHDDVEWLRARIFDPAHLHRPFLSANTELHKRIRYLE